MTATGTIELPEGWDIKTDSFTNFSLEGNTLYISMSRLTDSGGAVIDQQTSIDFENLAVPVPGNPDLSRNNSFRLYIQGTDLQVDFSNPVFLPKLQELTDAVNSPDNYVSFAFSDSTVDTSIITVPSVSSEQYVDRVEPSANLTKNPSRLDLNGDGRVDLFDLLYLANELEM